MQMSGGDDDRNDENQLLQGDTLNAHWAEIPNADQLTDDMLKAPECRLPVLAPRFEVRGYWSAGVAVGRSSRDAPALRDRHRAKAR